MLLVTGFEVFAELDVNPSAEIAHALGHEPDVEAEVLPVVFEEADKRLVECLEALQPEAILMFGFHRGEEIRLERVALNLDDCNEPDNSGATRRGQPIRKDGPTAYWSSVRLDAFAQSLEHLRIPFSWSRDAGGFLCNHSFYVARYESEARGALVPCGFVHVPSANAIPLAAQITAARAFLDIVRER